MQQLHAALPAGRSKFERGWGSQVGGKQMWVWQRRGRAGESTSCLPGTATGPPSWAGRTKVCKAKAMLQKGEGEMCSSGTPKRVTRLSRLIINIILWPCTVLYNHLSNIRHALVLLQCASSQIRTAWTLRPSPEPGRLLLSHTSHGASGEEPLAAPHSAAGDSGVCPEDQNSASAL